EYPRPRSQYTGGPGPGVRHPFVRRARAAEGRGLLRFGFRHRVDELLVDNGTVTGVRGGVLADDAIERGRPSSREVSGEFEYRARAVIVASGGIGGNHELVRRNWPARLGD